MAINTESRRRSILGMALAFLVIAPVPDTLIDAPDRKHIVGIYAGINAAVGTTGVHILSTGPVAPNHVSDSPNNLLLAGALEAQQGAWLGGVTNHAQISDAGDVILAGTGRILESAKFKLTAIGGFAVKLTNQTGGDTVAGQLVAVYSATAVDDAFKTAAASDDNVIGTLLDAGIADGNETWVVVSGIADVLMDAGGSARGDRIISSATAGSADVWNVGGAVATHFLEIGHCIETRTGAGLARCILHFN